MAICPFADQSKRYDKNYAGSYVGGSMWRGVLHTTETPSVPGYGGGATAPHFTIDLARLKLYQHFDTARPARALRHPAGTVETNNLRAIQFEITAYSDEAMARKVKGGIAVSQLTPVHYAFIAKCMRWVESVHPIQRSSGGLAWRAYPGSAGTSNGVRMTSTAWRKFGAWCAHEHVPANTHGDASNMKIALLVGGTSPAPTPEDDMPTAAEIAKATVDEWLARDTIKAPKPDPKNPNWTIESATEWTLRGVSQTGDKVDHLLTQTAALAAAVKALADNVGLNGDDLVAVVKQAAQDALADVQITLVNAGKEN